MRKFRLLIVDDNQALLEALRLALEDLFEVWSAVNAETALGVCERALPDIVLTDYRLEGMNGLELARVLKTRQPSLPVMLYSADTDLAGLGLEEAGILASLDKLADVHTLSQKLLAAVGRA